MNAKHLPYQIDPDKNRFHYYENYWKVKALDLLDKHVEDKKSIHILDYGCGRGELLQMAKERGYQVKGVDFDAECVRIASAHGETNILNIENPVNQLGEKSFDIVVCLHVLEHVDTPITVLRDLARISKKYVVLAVPNLRVLTGLCRRKINLEHVNEGHLQSWDHAHLLNLAVRHCGLKLVAWEFDATIISGFSQMIYKVFGNRMAIRLETGLFKRLFPYHGISVLGLFQVEGKPPS